MSDGNLDDSPRSVARMRRFGLAAVVAAACGGSGQGTPRYSPPSAEEPHAVVEVRTRYTPTAANLLVESVALGGARVVGSTQVAGGYTREVRVRPGLVAWTLGASLFRSHTETVVEAMPIAIPCGKFVCASQVAREVEKEIDDLLGACTVSLRHQAVAGERYVVQFDFLGTERCRAVCMRQAGASTNDMTPCLVDPAAPLSSGGR